ncbi:hypothetical protein [Prochlorococcus marinus]|nr:hypothetical protein [Prochlorococcus marinus]
MVRPQILQGNHGLKLWISLLTAMGLSLSLEAAKTRAGDGAGTLGEPLKTSTSEQLTLVRHLNNIGAVFYGSWSCPACFFQKNLFGKQASTMLTYVECGKPKLLPNQAADCQKAQVSVVPTWILPDGKRREGVLSIEELAIWTEMPARPE